MRTLVTVFLIVSMIVSVHANDRKYTYELAYKISFPVLDALSQGKLKETMPLEAHNPEHRKAYAYLEALGRTLCGIAPWLELGPGNDREGKMREELLQLAHKGIKNAVDPQSPDYMNFMKGTQPLVDAAFLAQAFLRSPQYLWGGLDDITKERVITEFKNTRNIKPWYNNWLLFSGMIEAFFLSIDEEWDPMRVDYALRTHDNWYKGDGVYGDGPDFHWDYYNSFVIQPMIVEITSVLYQKKKNSKEQYEKISRRMTRYAEILERMISPEGTIPPMGRSLVYRTGALQALSLAALREALPANVSPGQARSALTEAAKKIFSMKGNFDKNGWLTLGFAGHQPEVAESYICTGSLYLCMAGFLHLGLPADHEFWTSPAEEWTSRKAYTGKSFPIDKAIR